MEETEEFENVTINLPDLEETQIWQNENEKREVALYLRTSNGKAMGPEYTPFELPYRWTFFTLQLCIVDYIKRTTGKNEIVIDQLYYRKSKGKALVFLNNDGDIPAMLNEYPTTYKSGKNKKSATIYMAVDFHEQPAKGNQTTPRRSPRIQARNDMDVFVYEMSPDKKVLTTSNVLHKVNCDTSLQELITLLKTYDDESMVYTPAQGLYWLRKGGKQPVSLCKEEDLDICKKEYNSKNLRLACCTVGLKKQCAEGNNTNPRKRKLDMTTSTQSENEEWNDTHVQLVRDLEKKGILWRYSTKHLTLWTDEIINGNSGGISDEPNWDNHIEAVLVPPKSKRQSSNSTKDDKSKNDFQSTFEMMIALDAKRNETFQNALMQMVLAQTSLHMQTTSPNIVTMPSSTGKAMNQMTIQDCVNFVQSIGLSKYCGLCEENTVDGPMLEAFIHPQMGKQLMMSMGITEQDCICLIPAIYRLRARGYNNQTST